MSSQAALKQPTVEGDGRRSLEAMWRRRPIDLVHLARQTLGDRDLEREVLSLFVNHVNISLRRLRDAKSLAEIQEVAHSIVGSAKGLGAWKVAEEAELIEHRSGPDVDISALSGAVKDANSYIQQLIR